MLVAIISNFTRVQYRFNLATIKTENNIYLKELCIRVASQVIRNIRTVSNTPQKLKFSIKDFFGKCDQIRIHFLCSENCGDTQPSAQSIAQCLVQSLRKYDSEGNGQKLLKNRYQSFLGLIVGLACEKSNVKLPGVLIIYEGKLDRKAKLQKYCFCHQIAINQKNHIDSLDYVGFGTHKMAFI